MDMLRIIVRGLHGDEEEEDSDENEIAGEKEKRSQKMAGQGQECQHLIGRLFKIEYNEKYVIFDFDLLDLLF